MENLFLLPNGRRINKIGNIKKFLEANFFPAVRKIGTTIAESDLICHINRLYLVGFIKLHVVLKMQPGHIMPWMALCIGYKS